MSFAKLSFAEIEQRQASQQRDGERGGNRQALLLFKNSPEEIFAVPLASILRLEKFQIADIERVGRQEFLPYRGRGLPLVRLENHLPIRAIENELTEAYLIIPKAGNGAAGIIASQILDTLEVDLKLDHNIKQSVGVSGSAFINNHLTVVVDPEGVLKAAGIGELSYVG